MAANRFARLIAGTIWMFLGSYFVTFGVLAILYFEHFGRRTASMWSGAAALFGALLVFRAERLLGWKRWFYWLLIMVMLGVTIVWFAPALIRFPNR